MDIADFTKQEVEAIVAEWVEFARTRMPSSQDLSREELADHASVLLRAVAADIGKTQGTQVRHDRSRGDSPGTAPDITRIARDHAAQRFAQGFSFDHLVAEFRALRASVIRRWVKQVGEPKAEDLEDLTRFGEAMDQALSESTSLYSRKVDDSRNLLLGVLGHDLRTPLGVVHMSASFLLRADTLDGPQTKAVARILTAAERMRDMVKDILDFTQTAFGVTLPITPAPADLGEVALQVVGEVSTVYPDSKIELHCDGSLAGSWDAARIGQMLANLVANAVQHGAALPVTVTAAAAEDGVNVQVHNKGKPISAETQRTLFSPLRQASDGGRRPGSSGLGLGLYIVREIATAHGGSVQVRSDDQGTTFSVRLPREPIKRQVHAARRSTD